MVVGIVVSYLTSCCSSSPSSANYFLKSSVSVQRRVSKEFGRELSFMPVKTFNNNKTANLFVAVGRELEPKLLGNSEKNPNIV